jgi:hypothetical protein
MTFLQALLNESTARASADDLVNQGDKKDKAIKKMTIPSENFLYIMRLLLHEGRFGAENRS